MKSRNLRPIPIVIPQGLYFKVLSLGEFFCDRPHLTTFDNKLGRGDWKGGVVNGYIGYLCVYWVLLAIPTIPNLPSNTHLFCALPNLPTNLARLYYSKLSTQPIRRVPSRGALAERQ